MRGVLLVARGRRGVGGLAIWLLAGMAWGEPAPEREQIGEVLGRPVYRDELHLGESERASDELRRRFMLPLMDQYCRDHADALEPTREEVQAVAEFLDREHAAKIRTKAPALQARIRAIAKDLKRDGLDEKTRALLVSERWHLYLELQSPGRFFAAPMLRAWKLEKHLYDEFGGGRVLTQQAGIEAFDATHRWLKQQEGTGKLKISDPALRSSLYDYWTTKDHSPEPIEDADVIRTEFLQPEWAPREIVSE